MNQEELKSVIHYDALTGLFRWRFGGRSHGGKKQPWALAGTPHNCGYTEISINRKRYLAHRLAWLYVYGKWPKNYIDHINCIRSDNKIENLRDVSHQTNMQNLRSANRQNTSGFMGVNWRGDRNKWRASIRVDHKQKHIGMFDSAEEAHAAYIKAKREFHQGNTL